MAKECAVRHNPVAMSGRNPIIHSFWLGGHQGVDDRADVKRPIRYTRYLSDIKPFSGFSHAAAAGLPCEARFAGQACRKRCARDSPCFVIFPYGRQNNR